MVSVLRPVALAYHRGGGDELQLGVGDYECVEVESRQALMNYKLEAFRWVPRFLVVS
jgi:hypothetical protein